MLFGQSGLHFHKILLFLLTASILLLCPRPSEAADTPAATPQSQDEAQGKSLTEINKKLTNPVSELWSIAFQQNNY